MRLALIDHYDSFSWNVLDWLVGPRHERVEVMHVAWDDREAIAAVEEQGLPLVLSPGPGSPVAAKTSCELVARNLGRVPILGVCLGHQILAYVSGAPIVRAKAPFHGTRKIIQVVPDDILAGLPPQIEVATYNSLVVAAGDLPAPWQVRAWSAEDGDLQAMARLVEGQAPAFGLQFHPESFMSQGAAQIRGNFIAWINRMGPGSQQGSRGSSGGDASLKRS